MGVSQSGVFSILSDQDRSLQSLLPYAVVSSSILLVAFWAFQSFYRLHLHPLAKFPGPREAKTSRKWLTTVANTGSSEAVFEEMHAKFNTKALRIAPNELHITDASLYKTVYSQTNPFPKEPLLYDAFMVPTTLFAEQVPSLHKERRKMLNPLFSRQGMTKLEPVITSTIEVFMQKVRRLAKKGPINIFDAYSCVTVDVISEFAFGRSLNLLEESGDGFSTVFLKANEGLGPALWELYYNPTLLAVAKRIPLWFMAKINPDLKAVHDVHVFAANSLKQYKEKSGSMEKPSHPIVFDHLTTIPDKQQALEAVDVLIAGADTTAYTLCIATYHLNNKPAIREKLVSALKEAIPNKNKMPSLLELEQIKYLYAVVKEALRIAMPVPGRLPRVVPNRKEPFIVDGMIVPPGTIVGMSAYTMHRDKEIWGKDAEEFNPDRWLGGDAAALNNHLYTFSKGLRSCIGINVAHAELTLVLARIFRHFEMKTLSPKLEEMDYFVASLRGSKLMVDFKERTD